MERFKTLSIFAVTLMTLLCIHSCKKDSLKNCEEHTVSDCYEDANKTNIRIKNVSKYDFCNVLLDPSFAKTNYGIIKKRKTTCYRSFDLAYDYAGVQLFIGAKEFVLYPLDYVGEEPLGTGKFTYSIDVTDFDGGKLSIEATVD